MWLSQLFAPGKDTLVIYSMMFPRAPDEDLPCPSCTQFLDSFDGVVEHASQRVNVAIVAKAALPRLLAHAETRGWRRLRVLSCAGNAYNRDYRGETADGSQQLPMLNVFRRDGDTIRHFWGSELLYEPPDPARTRATPRPSTPCGTSSTSPRRAAGPTGTRRLPTSAAPSAARRRGG